MNKKSLLGLILFAGVVVTGLFAGAELMISQGRQYKANTESYTKEEDISNTGKGVDTLENASGDDIADATENASGGDIADATENASGGDIADATENASGDDITDATGENNNTGSATATPSKAIAAASTEGIDLTVGSVLDIMTVEPWLSTNPTDTGAPNANQAATGEQGADAETKNNPGAETFTTSVDSVEAPQLITDSSDVDYKAYIPEMVYDSVLETALDINNPDIAVDAEGAVLFDVKTKKVLYYKNPVQALFPASTAKLLTSLVALKYCAEDEEVTVGDEISMIAPDSTRADLKEGEILTIRNILEGMLLPSGNDAAYVIAAYVGRKSLDNFKASKEEAIAEFIRLMNEEANQLGVKNSCFKTPDGYDAVGQYTTAYDMGIIGVEAAKNTTIVEIAQKSRSRNIFVSGEDVTWSNTNKLITRYSGQYYSKAIGLKTGTSSMAGRCIVAAAESEGKKVVCVILDSSSAGRWEDAIALLKYGLK